MSSRLNRLFENNRAWAQRMEQADPGFFGRLAQGQTPELLWVGCSDSRVPANELVGLGPGEVFVHRNIANIVVHSDMNCQAVIQYAVANLRVRDIIVVGHYRCGGVRAALDEETSTIVDEWIAPIRALRRRYKAFLDRCPSEVARWDKLCELNVLEQAHSLAQASIIREAWAARQEVTIHGWIYAVEDGHLRDLKITMSSAADSEQVLQTAQARIMG
ncbi:MAG TPA: carbonic anhydrase [Candidatus Binataceae bacterium]|nr:carbonic anhydrase [Candidatus Binataceae bacterium]